MRYARSCARGPQEHNPRRQPRPDLTQAAAMEQYAAMDLCSSALRT
jgi:hypothetical protein